MPNNSRPVGRAVATLIPMFLATLAFTLYAIGTPLSSALPALAIGWLFVLFLEFIFPLIVQGRGLRFQDKLAAQARHEATGIIVGAALVSITANRIIGKGIE